MDSSKLLHILPHRDCASPINCCVPRLADFWCFEMPPSRRSQGDPSPPPELPSARHRPSNRFKKASIKAKEINTAREADEARNKSPTPAYSGGGPGSRAKYFERQSAIHRPPSEYLLANLTKIGKELPPQTLQVSTINPNRHLKLLYKPYTKTP